MDRTSLCNKIDAVRLYASYRLNLLLLIRADLRTLCKDGNVRFTKDPLNHYLINNVEDIVVFSGLKGFTFVEKPLLNTFGFLNINIDIYFMVDEIQLFMVSL